MAMRAGARQPSWRSRSLKCGLTAYWNAWSHCRHRPKPDARPRSGRCFPSPWALTGAEQDLDYDIALARAVLGEFAGMCPQELAAV